MSSLITKINNKVFLAAIAITTTLPSIVGATGKHYRSRGWFSDFWQWLFGGGATSGGSQSAGGTTAVPEFSAGTAAIAITLLVGGTLVLLSQRRKKRLSN